MEAGGLLRLDYGLERRPWADPDLDQLDVWEVVLRLGTLTNGDVEDDEVSWDTVARAWLFGMDPERNILVDQRPCDVADAHSAEAAYYFAHVFDQAGGFLADIDGQFEWAVGRALFLHDVQVPQAHRRRGYASILAADAILTLAPAGTAVFAHPGPTDLESEGDDEVAWLHHEAANTRFLARLGFVPFRDRLWTLDLSAGDGMATLANIRRS